MTTNRTCDCGSGYPRQALHDGYGIFLCYVCSRCKRRKLASYRPDIMTRYQCDEQIEAD